MQAQQVLFRIFALEFFAACNSPPALFGLQLHAQMLSHEPRSAMLIWTSQPHLLWALC